MIDSHLLQAHPCDSYFWVCLGVVSISKGLRAFKLIFKEFFLFINLTFVTGSWENKNVPIESVTWSEIFYCLTSSLNSKCNCLSFNYDLVIRKWNRKSLIVGLVSRSNFFYFWLWFSNSKCDFSFFSFKLVTSKWKK